MFKVEDFLDYFGFPRPVKRGVNWMSSCPDFEGRHNHGDKRYSWGIHYETGISNCFVCGGMGLELLTARLLAEKLGRRVSIIEAAGWLEERYGLKTPPPDELAKIGLNLEGFDPLNKAPTEIKSYPESILYPYLGKVHKESVLDHPTRKISVETCVKWEIGYDVLSQRTIIPYRRRNKSLVGLLSRATSEDDPLRYQLGVPNIDPFTGNLDEQEPVKYKWSKAEEGAIFGEVHFRSQRPILIVESFFDVLWLDQLGITEEMNVGAIGGSSISEKQALNLMSWTTVYTGLDSDSAGKVGTARIRKLVRGPHIAMVEWSKYGGKDPGDLGAEEIREAIISAKNVFDLPAL